MYSNGLSETILGKAVKKLGLRREEIVIMTKVRLARTLCICHDTHDTSQVYQPCAHDTGTNIVAKGLNPDDIGLVNQWGLSRKHIFDSIKGSLARLQLDYVDVLQCAYMRAYSDTFCG